MARGLAARNLPVRIGRHEIVGFIATGGMAELFLAKDPATHKPVVIKRILPHLARQPNYVSMFIDEARIGSMIRHPNLVDVYELGKVGGDPFLVMAYLEGENVAGLIRRLISRNERIGYGLAAYVIAQTCLGLHAAHELADEDGKPLEIVHRDISPQNIFVTYDGFVKLLDFGIATAAHRVTQTSTGQLKGKFAYMSPEQCRSEPLDARSDIFSLGVALYELSTCKRLFQRANELLVLKAVCDEPISRPSQERPHYPASLEAICMRALERDRERRYASAADMHRDLVAVLKELGLANDGRMVMGEEMARLFENRIAEKRTMLDHLRTGARIDELPPVEVDETVEVPLATHVTPTSPKKARAESNDETQQLPALSDWQPPPEPAPAPQPQPQPQHPTERSRAKLAIVLALAFLVVAAGGAVVAWQWLGYEKRPAPEPELIVKMTPLADEPPASPPISSDVVLTIATTPPGATVYLDGEKRGETPIDLLVPRSSRTARLELRRSGYATASEDLVLDRDQRVRLSLKRRVRHDDAGIEPGVTEQPDPTATPPADAPAGATEGADLFEDRR